MALRSALGSTLSEASTIALPGDPGFDALKARWREWHGPSLSAIVKPSTEADVQEIVSYSKPLSSKDVELKPGKIRYANDHNIPFITRSGGHGATEALASAEGAIQIDLRDMSTVEVSQDGSSVKIGGGTNVKQLTSVLAKTGKHTCKPTFLLTL